MARQRLALELGDRHRHQGLTDLRMGSNRLDRSTHDGRLLLARGLEESERPHQRSAAVAPLLDPAVLRLLRQLSPAQVRRLQTGVQRSVSETSGQQLPLVVIWRHLR